jgi:hypothetical protein
MSTAIRTLPLAHTTSWRAPLQEHAGLLSIVAVHFAVALALCWAYPEKYRHNLELSNYLLTLALGLCFAVCGYALYVMLFRRPARLVHYLRQQLAAYLTRERLLFAAPVLAMMPLFGASFTVIKAAVPLYQPFAWDTRLAAIDQWLHGGTAPWLWLQVLLDHPLLTGVVMFVYHLWFFIMLGTIYWLAFAMERRAVRLQFVLSFVISWILLGNLMAMLFSSAGPCYYGRVTGAADPYLPLMQYLRDAHQQVPVWSLKVQEMLWHEYTQQAGANALSISAMPSMHVATAVLIALLGWRLNRLAGIAATVFAAMIMVGSVHLGWHYAIDGYVGALGAWLVWLAVGCLPRVRAAQKEQNV